MAEWTQHVLYWFKLCSQIPLDCCSAGYWYGKNVESEKCSRVSLEQSNAVNEDYNYNILKYIFFDTGSELSNVNALCSFVRHSRTISPMLMHVGNYHTERVAWRGDTCAPISLCLIRITSMCFNRRNYLWQVSFLFFWNIALSLEQSILT